MLINIIKSSTKTDKQFFIFLNNYLKTSDKYSIRENYYILFDYFSLYLTVFENQNGHLGIPFL